MKNRILIFTTIVIGLCLYSCAGSRYVPGSDGGMVVDFNKHPEMKKDVDEVAEKVANQIMRCCSVSTGRNVTPIVDYLNVTQSPFVGNNSMVIPMKITWVGKWTSREYWVKGKLYIDNNGNRTWKQLTYSGHLSSNDCMINCIERRNR